MEERVNPRLEAATYAVRGAITDRASEIEKQLRNGSGSFSFKKVVWCNIGNPQALKQQPLSYPRQLVACSEYPELVEAGPGAFPADVINRSSKLRQAFKTGAYTASNGHAVIREAIAEGVSARDGHLAQPDDIFVTNGASASVHMLFQALITDHHDAFLVPIPQYPLYSAALTLYGGTLLPYYLDESQGWSIDIEEVATLLQEARDSGMRVRGMVVINPGNPTGQVLDVRNQEALVTLCADARVPIVADEVYQENIWGEGKSFTSFRKVALDAAVPNATVFSLHSISKGFFGECGHRGGYMEALNVPSSVLVQLRKLANVSLCSNTVGQLILAAMMSPPKEGEASYGTYAAERATILASLKRRARKLSAALRAMEGVTCCEPEGALYAFPRIMLPDAACAAAEEEGRAPDMHYCCDLLEATGIVAVPGSGFKQREGTHHIRLTILPPEEDMDDVIERLAAFHASFMATFLHKRPCLHAVAEPLAAPVAAPLAEHCRD